MNVSNLVMLAILIGFLLLIVQRSEKKRRWWTAIGVLLPLLLIYRWAVYKSQQQETLIAAGIAVGVNVLFWLVYGRRHPPGSSEDIRVFGMED